MLRFKPHNYFASGLQKALHHKLILAQAKVITASQSTCTIVFVIFTKGGREIGSSKRLKNTVFTPR
jgi:hypothetical protein